MTITILGQALLTFGINTYFGLAPGTNCLHYCINRPLKHYFMTDSNTVYLRAYYNLVLLF